MTENLVDVRADEILHASVIVDEVTVDLGIWLSGIESFLATGNLLGGSRDSSRNSLKEFELVHSALVKCSLLSARSPAASDVSIVEIERLSAALREMTILSDALIRSKTVGLPEWHAWSNVLSTRLSAVPAFGELIRAAETEGEKYLPATLNEIVTSNSLLQSDHVELALVLPRFAKILRWLAVVGKMLSADEPLKPSLLIFSRVNEQIFELTNYINNRLERFPDEEAELFTSLDAASYTASIELKKVYSQELAGLASLRPAPSIYARIETAHSLLNDSFQQILADFARLVDPAADVFQLFPNFKLKLERSIALRDELKSMLETVQAAEQNTEKRQVEKLRKQLLGFASKHGRFLFYKDTETIERFIEEVLLTKQDQDLVPLLHRFGAYLETLYGQISLRAVLQKYPQNT